MDPAITRPPIHPLGPSKADDAGHADVTDREERTTTLLTRAAVTDDPHRCSELRDEAVLLNQCLAHKIARRYRGRGVDQDDLEQIALLALCKAVLGYEPQRGPTFTAYAVVTISGEVKRYFRDHGWLVRPNRAVQDLCVSMRNSNGALTQRLRRQPSIDDVAADLDISPAEVIRARQAEVGYVAFDLNQPNADGSGRTFEEQVADPDDLYSKLDERMWLRAAVNRLPERERLILHLRLDEQLSQSAIGEQVGISQMQVSRILRRIVGSLRDEAHLQAEAC